MNTEDGDPEKLKARLAEVLERRLEVYKEWERLIDETERIENQLLRMWRSEHRPEFNQ